MKAIRINEYGNIDCLCYEEIDEPICPDDKVKVKIYYFSMLKQPVLFDFGTDGQFRWCSEKLTG